MYVATYMLIREEKERRKKQINNKAKQRSTPEVVTFPKKVLPQVGFEPTTLDTLDRVLYQLSH